MSPLGMGLVQEGVQFQDMNRECTAAVTALRPIVHCSCDVAAKCPRLKRFSQTWNGEAAV